MQMFVKTAIAAITALCAVGTHGYNCQTMTTATGNNVCYCDSGCTGSCCTGQTAFIWGANKDLASESCTSCAGSSYQDVSGSQQGTLTTLNGTVGSAPLPPSTLPPLPPDSSWMIPQNRTRRDCPSCYCTYSPEINSCFEACRCGNSCSSSACQRFNTPSPPSPPSPPCSDVSGAAIDQDGDCLCPRGTPSCSGRCTETTFTSGGKAFYWKAGSCSSCKCDSCPRTDYTYAYPSTWTTVNAGCGDGVARRQTEVESCSALDGCSCSNQRNVQTQTENQVACAATCPDDSGASLQDTNCVCPGGTPSCSGGCTEGTFQRGGKAFYWTAGSCNDCKCNSCPTTDYVYTYPPAWTTVNTGCGDGVARQRTEVESCTAPDGCSCSNQQSRETQKENQVACITTTATTTTTTQIPSITATVTTTTIEITTATTTAATTVATTVNPITTTTTTTTPATTVTTVTATSIKTTIASTISSTTTIATTITTTTMTTATTTTAAITTASVTTTLATADTNVRKDNQNETATTTTITTAVKDNADASGGSDGGGGGGGAAVVGVVVGVLLLLGIGIFAFVTKKRTAHLQQQEPAQNFELVLDDMLETGRIDQDQASARLVPREIDRGNVNLVSKLGSGQFGDVWKGLLDESDGDGPPEYLVAVKTVKVSGISSDGIGRGSGSGSGSGPGPGHAPHAPAPPTEMEAEALEELLAEAAVMAQVGAHPNLVALIGVHTTTPEKMIVLSFCEHGSMLSLLRGKKKDGAPADAAFKLNMMLEVARGMAHLHAKRFVHRDLAARNVLVATGNKCKVADFGLSRVTVNSTGTNNDDDDGDDGNGGEEQYYRSQAGTFPIRWTAPECMVTMRFNQASDIWSFGVTFYECFTDGGKPYAGMNNIIVMTKVQSGYKLMCPDSCPQNAYAVLLGCLTTEPVKRPTFTDLVSSLEKVAHGIMNAAPGGARTSNRYEENTIVAKGSRYVPDGFVTPHVNGAIDDDGYQIPDKDGGSASASVSGGVGGNVPGMDDDYDMPTADAANAKPTVVYAQYMSASEGGGIRAAAINASNDDYELPTADAANAKPTVVVAQYISASEGGGIRAAAINASNDDYEWPTADAANAKPTVVVAQCMSVPNQAPNSTTSDDGKYGMPADYMHQAAPTSQVYAQPADVDAGSAAAETEAATPHRPQTNRGQMTARSSPKLSSALPSRPVLSAGRGARTGRGGGGRGRGVGRGAGASNANAVNGGGGGLSAAVRSGRSAASVKRVQSRAATLSRATTVEGACTVIFAGKKAGAKMWLIGSASTDGASGKLEIYEKKGAGTRGMPKMTIRGKNIISAKMTTFKGKEAVLITDGQNQDPAKAKETTFLASDADGQQLLADLLTFASRKIGCIGEEDGEHGLMNSESSL